MAIAFTGAQTGQASHLLRHFEAREEVGNDGGEQHHVVGQELGQVGVAHGPGGAAGGREQNVSRSDARRSPVWGRASPSQQESLYTDVCSAPPSSRRCKHAHATTPDEHGVLRKARVGALERARHEQHALDSAHAKVVVILQEGRGEEGGYGWL